MQPEITVIIPCYNERRTIAATVKNVHRALPDAEIIAVDDGSTDGTRQVLCNTLCSIRRTSLVPVPVNVGKGMAIRWGVRFAEGRYVLIQDADGEYSPDDYPKLIAAMRGGARAVYGSRFLRHNRFLPHSWLANKVLILLTNLLYGAQLTDMETGYKLIERDLLRDLGLTSLRFEIEVEITAKLLRRGVKIVEVPIGYQARREGKKTNWRDFVQAVWCLLKWKLK